MRRVYLDIDGVLLGENDGRVVLANHALEFVDFLTGHFEVYWLTTHCRGDSQSVLNYLRRFAPADFLTRLTAIKATNFDVLKSEALGGDFYWVDDSPLEAELESLRKRNLFDRWIEVNTRKRPEDLLFAMGELRNALSSNGNV